MDGRPINQRPAVDRAAILADLGSGAGEIEEVLRYTRREGHPQDEREWIGLAPELPDEAFVETWSDYLREAEAHGVWPTLRRKLIQLGFDIRAGRSVEPAYLDATRFGLFPTGGESLELSRPETLVLSLHRTAAGRVPVLFAPHRADFVKLIQALACRNEPFPVPEAQRACFVAGYTNWDRLHAPRVARGQETAAPFQPPKSSYQDTIILLGSGPYSAVPAAALGLADEEWERLSLVIRREHECAHYVVRRFLGRLSRRADDEVLADFVGLSAACGHYPAEWALRFLGLENFPRYRFGGRLEHYRNCTPLPPLSDAAFTVLTALIHRAVRQLETFLANGCADLRDPQERTRWLLTLSALTFEELAAPATSAWLVATVGRRSASSGLR